MVAAFAYNRLAGYGFCEYQIADEGIAEIKPRKQGNRNDENNNV